MRTYTKSTTRLNGQRHTRRVTIQPAGASSW